MKLICGTVLAEQKGVEEKENKVSYMACCFPHLFQYVLIFLSMCDYHEQYVSFIVGSTLKLFFGYHITLSSVQVPHLHIKIVLCLILILSLTIVGIAHLGDHQYTAKVARYTFSCGDSLLCTQLNLTFHRLSNISGSLFSKFQLHNFKSSCILYHNVVLIQLGIFVDK